MRAFALGIAMGCATAACLVPAGARAADFTLLGGLQVNDDFQVTEADDQPETVLASIGSPGDDVELDDGGAIGLAADFVFNDNPEQRIGLWISHQDSDFDDNSGLVDTGITITHVHFTAMSYYPSGKWEPFVLAGLGATVFDPDDSSLSSETKFSAQLGAGANYRLSNSLLLRADIRWVPSFIGSGGSAFCKGGGCTIEFSSDFYSQVQANLGVMFRF